MGIFAGANSFLGSASFLSIASILFFRDPTLAKRESIALDFGWKHRAGLHDWPSDPYEPPLSPNSSYIDPGEDPSEASADYLPCDWITVQLPHDGIISNPYGNQPSTHACPDGCSGRSYIPRHVLWYRKQFVLPSHWQQEITEAEAVLVLHVEGSFRNTTVYWNGKRIHNHDCGYTPFRVELNVTDDSVQTLAIFVDPNNGDAGGPSRGSGWWYEGGGLYRHVVLEKIPKPARIAHNGVFVTSRWESGSLQIERHLRQSHFKSPMARLTLRATLEIEEADAVYACNFWIRDAHGSVQKTPIQTLTAESTSIVHQNWTVNGPFLKLWTSSSPHLYEVTAYLYRVNKDLAYEQIDSVSVNHGIRKLFFDANKGVFWNDEPYKIRGFCDHDTFAVVGMAMADRLHLFRAQASRSIGGNARRASHNPPDPSNLDIYDRLGMVVIDENRLFENSTRFVKNMADLVRRDRNHPSVIVWSFCNEVGCEDFHEQGGPAFQNVTNYYDGSRPTLANMFTFNDLLSNTIDVQGFSHEPRKKLDDCHSQLPNKPIIQSECCSCNTMRDEDEGCETENDNPHYECNQKAFNARCLERLVNASDGTEYASGTFVWTLFDYYGEPPSRPMTVSSTYGQFDLCGFPKAAAFWFRTQWLLDSHSTTERHNTVLNQAVINGRPFVKANTFEVRIVESWESPDHWKETEGNRTRTIHVYSNAPMVELFVNGHSMGKQGLGRMVDSDQGTYGEWMDVPWKAGVLTAMAQSSNGTELVRTTKETNIIAQPSLVLSLDCPSPLTGTGESLFLDGQDIALVRASIMDGTGRNVLHFSNHTIRFKIVSGPGTILGTANGDPKSYWSHTSPEHPAYHGLVRAVVRVTSIAGLSTFDKELLRSIEVKDNKSDCNRSYHAMESVVSYEDTNDIVIEATAPGLAPSQLYIPTSISREEASVLAIASKEATGHVDFFSTPET